MKASFIIENHMVHLWRACLSDLVAQENEFLSLLNPAELDRANRFQFPIHRSRFILTRGILRKVLSQYLAMDAALIEFDYGPRGKPHLRVNPFNLHFNVSHSDDAVVLAFTIDYEIGVDIQKKEATYQEAVATRFFSLQEVSDLQQLSNELRAAAFYQLWASKEALIKAVGEGLYVPLGDFSVNLHESSQWVSLTVADKTEEWYLESFSAYLNYQSAFATPQKIIKVTYWEWLTEGPNLLTSHFEKIKNI